MTDILFVNATQKDQLRFQINGTMLLATKLLGAGFNVEILRYYEIKSYDSGDYYKFIDDITNKIISINPKCVSFYALWPDFHVILRIAQRVKEENPAIVVVMGGPQASATAHAIMEAMSFVDYVSTGEGEKTVVPFFNSILRENRKNIDNIAGLYYREENEIKFNNSQIEFCDLNGIPPWDDSLYTSNETDLDRDDYFMPIDVGRGCPFSCTFCCTSLFWKRTYRMKSPEKIVEEIKYYHEKFGIKSFRFSHDAFTVNQNLVSKVCDYIIENKLDIKWVCTTRVNCINEELILKMKKAGMIHIELGVETGSPRMQKLTRKKLDIEMVREKVKMMIDHKIGLHLFFMYGFPEETEEDLNQTLDLVLDFLDMGINKASMSYCRFSPGTDITNRYFDELVFDPDVKILSQGILGYSEENEMIKENKELFSPFYHLRTKVRNEYQYLFYFVHLYQKFSNSFKRIRSYYKGDNLRFYKDFYHNNLDMFNGDMTAISKNIKENLMQMFCNTIKNFDCCIRDRACAILEYEFDLQTVLKSRENMSIRKTYAFDYIEYQMKVPLDMCTDAETELLIEKKNGKVDVRVMAM